MVNSEMREPARHGIADQNVTVEQVRIQLNFIINSIPSNFLTTIYTVVVMEERKKQSLYI